jgi:hypothetical protein
VTPPRPPRRVRKSSNRLVKTLRTSEGSRPRSQDSVGRALGLALEKKRRGHNGRFSRARPKSLNNLGHAQALSSSQAVWPQRQSLAGETVSTIR